ncbi:cell division protein FtsN [Burkholderia ambifaria]|nr:cell division protein FtsN [Burkholderia contaminans]
MLGLIVGLAIAVVVALYITRSPSPFVSKVAPPPTDTGASQPQQFDPNRALQGKTPGQPVPQAAQPAPPNTAPGQAANQTQGGLLPEPQIVEVPPSGNANGSNTTASNNATSGNGVAVAPKPADNTPPPKKTQQAQQQQQGGEDDLARFAAQKQAQQAAAQKQQQQQLAANTPKPAPSATSATSAAAAKPPTANDANTGYFLQVGAYKTEGDAEQQRARLGFQGFESKVSKRDVSGVTYFRVRVGPFSKFEDMNSARQRLSDAGVDTAVIRFTKQ